MFFVFFFFFFFNDTATTEIYTLSLHDALPISLALRQDLEPHGVGVSCVFPGFVRDAGMFASSGATLPPGVGTVTPEAVAAGIVRAVERNRAEVDVAPFGLRLGARVAGVAPGLTASVQKKLGGDRVARAIADGQRERR